MTLATDKTLLIAAGGTGGHVFPALSVAQWWQTQGGDVCWLGTEHGVDSRVVPAHNIRFSPLPVSGLRGRGFRRRVVSLIGLVRSVWQALRYFRRERPAVVLSMGGYASAPGAIAAFFLRVPLVMHEQNSVAGLTNRHLARLATRVVEGFPHSFSKDRRAVHVGNPVRHEFFEVAPPEERYFVERTAFRVLVVGGSQGARIFNEQIPLATAEYHGEVPLMIKHQCGQNERDAVIAAYEQHGIKNEVFSFIDAMADALGWADLVIGRAGAMTVAELSAVGVPSILVPLKIAADDHQTGNARFLESLGASVLIPEVDFTPARLAKELNLLAANPAKRLKMARCARQAGMSDSAARVGQICQEVAR